MNLFHRKSKMERLLESLESQEILKTAAKVKADMIIMGKSTTSFLGNVVMGTTARRVSRLTDIPLLLVPNRKD